MKVTKTALIPAAPGTVLEVLEALQQSEAPSDAKVMSIKDDLSGVYADILKGEIPEFNGDNSLGVAVIELKWTRDEKGLDL